MSRFPLSFTTIFTLFVVSNVAYYFLLSDNFLHLSISSIIATSHRLDGKEHMLVLGFLPIYIAGMIFGAALLGLYVGSKLEHIFLHPNKNK